MGIAFVHGASTILCVHVTAIPPVETILWLFKNMFVTNAKPEIVTYIDLPVSKAVFDHCVSCGKACTDLPDLPFTGYMQASATISRECLIKWLDIQWEPVGSKLNSNDAYRKDFLEPNDATAAAYVYFPVHGVANLKKVGRNAKRGGPRPTAQGSHGKPLTAIR